MNNDILLRLLNSIAKGVIKVDDINTIVKIYRFLKAG
jgi:hypothetical protein